MHATHFLASRTKLRYSKVVEAPLPAQEGQLLSL